MSIFRKEDILGKDVIDAEGKILGKAADIAFDITGKVAIVVEGEGEQSHVYVDDIQAIGDVILLKPKKKAAISTSTTTTPQPASSQSYQSVQPSRYEARGGYEAGGWVYCPQCGHRNPAGMRYCENCGALLDTGEEDLASKFKRWFKR